MNNHPLNLALRFILEWAALAAIAAGTYQSFNAPWRLFMAIGIPLALAIMWAVFRVQGDPGPAPVAIPGWARLLLEGLLFGIALWMLYRMEYRLLFIFMLSLLLIHYLVSYDRILKILEHE